MLRVEMGWGGVGHVNVQLRLLREVDATCANGVGWGMLTFGCACYVKLMLRVRMGWGEGGIPRSGAVNNSIDLDRLTD